MRLTPRSASKRTKILAGKTSRWNISSNEGSATQSGDTLRAAIDSSMSATLPGREFFFAPPTEECPYCKAAIQNEVDLRVKIRELTDALAQAGQKRKTEGE